MTNHPAAVDPEVFVEPFHADGTKAFHLASGETAERGGIDKDTVGRVSRCSPPLPDRGVGQSH
jgi:hypothetical protein